MSIQELKRHLGLRSIEAEMRFQDVLYWVVLGYTPTRGGGFEDFSYSVFKVLDDSPYPTYLDSVKPAPEAFVAQMEALITESLERKSRGE